jgi:choline-glycine betaine transporter
MKNHMRSHIWMHGGLLAAIVAVVALNAAGFVVPSAFTYLIVVACPFMMVFMMVGMSHRQDQDGQADAGTGSDLEKRDVSR